MVLSFTVKRYTWGVAQCQVQEAINKYWLLILLESRAYILQFPDLGCNLGVGHGSECRSPLVWWWQEHTLDQVPWSQSIQFQASSEQDRNCNSVMMSAQQANLTIYWAFSLRPLHVSQHKDRKAHWRWGFATLPMSYLWGGASPMK